MFVYTKNIILSTSSLKIVAIVPTLENVLKYLCQSVGDPLRLVGVFLITLTNFKKNCAVIKED